MKSKARFILPANCDAKRILRHHCHRSCFAANIAAKYQREYEKHERHFRNEYFRPYSQRIFRTRCANFARWNSLRIAIRRKYEPGFRQGGKEERRQGRKKERWGKEREIEIGTEKKGRKRSEGERGEKERQVERYR